MTARQSDPNNGNSSATIASTYIREMLEFNPMWQSPQIIRRRHELWRGYEAPLLAPAASAGHDGSGESRLRNRARQCLEMLQSKFYQLPAEKLWQAIGVLENDRLPEYAATAARLQAAAKFRSELTETLRETGDAKFAYSLQRALVAPPAEAGTLREQYIESIISERRVSQACEIVARYAAVHPKIYELERDWFDVLLDRDNQREWKARYSIGTRTRKAIGGSSGGVWGSVGFFVLLAIIRGAMAIPQATPSNRNSQPIPAATQPTYPHPGNPNPGNPSTRVSPLPSNLTGTMPPPTTHQALPAFSIDPSDPAQRSQSMQDYFERINQQHQQDFQAPRADPNSWQQGPESILGQRMEEIQRPFQTPTFTPPTYTPPPMPSIPAPRSMSPSLPRPMPRRMSTPGVGGFQ